MENTIVLRNAKFVETTFEDGSKQLVGTVRGDSFSRIDIPTGPNPRQFTGDANPNYKDMVKTLRTEPEMFTRKNAGGITIFASSCDSNGDGSYTLTFNDGGGIANGSHTFFALKNHGSANSQVRVTVEIGLETSKTSEIAQALNLNKRLQAYSLQNKEGAFDWHKTVLGEKATEVIYCEGDIGSIEVKEEMAFLNLFKHKSDTKKLDILANIEQSEHANVAFLNKINQNNDHFVDSLQWIAKDVHDMVMYTVLNESFTILLKPLKRSHGQSWLKTRSAEKKNGIIKGLGILLIAGLANEGTRLNRNNIVVWKEDFKEPEQRKAFVNELFKKVFDVVTVEDGNASDIIRTESIRKKVVRHANLIAVRNTSKKIMQKRKAG